MTNNETPILKFAQAFALFTAVLIAIGVPLATFYFEYRYEIVRLQATLKTIATPVKEMIESNPDYWTFETNRLEGYLSMNPSTTDPECRHIMDKDGKMLARFANDIPVSFWPTIRVAHELKDFGQTVGRIEVDRSLKSSVIWTMIVGALSALFGGLIYWFLRVFPLRALERSWGEISYLASHDPLTGLSNRSMFIDRLEQALADASRQDNSIIVYAIDLDRFKDVNDAFGHSTGDRLLKIVAQRISSHTRKGDTLARLGGDEFALIQAGVDDPQVAASLAERVIKELSDPFNIKGHTISIGASVGMAFKDNDQDISAEELLKNADLALYKSKGNGRGTYCFFEEDMDRELRSRKAIESILRKALQELRFQLHYQPQIDLASERIIGAEALLRLEDPGHGNISPATFIPIAEQSGLILPITQWVLKTACTSAVKWDGLRIAVNISPSVLVHADLVNMVKSTLEQTGLPPERLELEITEEVLIGNTSKALKVLKKLKALGVCIAMDDFGTGYSSLAYMRKFPFDKLKIDRSFVANIQHSEDAQAIVRAIVGMGRALGMSVNAEGVETTEEASVLVQEQCDEVQGFLYARPMPQGQLDQLIKSGKIDVHDELDQQELLTETDSLVA
ncbi:MAG: putative bifunctional diguanylate cyclase/phosphodiesterase [Hyphomicrobiaceae bacterium]